MTNEEQYLKTDTIAERFDVETRTVRRWIEKGWITAKKHGATGRLLIPKAEVDAFEDRIKDPATEEARSSGANPTPGTRIGAKDPPEKAHQERTQADTSTDDEDADEATQDDDGDGFFDGW